MDQELKTLNSRQYDYLSAFFSYVGAVSQKKILKPDFAFWASQLDSLNIPWSLQNSVSALADVKENHQKYFRSHLKELNYTVQD